jgi:CRP-like cAMP-binding protein
MRMERSANRLLNCLSEQVFEAVRLQLVRREFRQGEVLGEPGQTVLEVLFPHSGMAVSLVVELVEGDMVETAMVGHDGMISGSAALGGKHFLNKTIIQIPGQGSVVSAANLVKLADAFPELRSLIHRHELVLLAQAQQAAACNASHLTEARLCWWLLRTRDLAARDDFYITQEYLAQMLGVRRTSISIVAATLQRAGLVKYKRGHIHVTDVDGLREGACECYGRVNAHYEGMLKPPPPRLNGPNPLCIATCIAPLKAQFI